MNVIPYLDSYICSMDFSSLSKGANLIFMDEVYNLQVTKDTMSKK
jgi:hypothetical protein